VLIELSKHPEITWLKKLDTSEPNWNGNIKCLGSSGWVGIVAFLTRRTIRLHTPKLNPKLTQSCEKIVAATEVATARQSQLFTGCCTRYARLLLLLCLRTGIDKATLFDDDEVALSPSCSWLMWMPGAKCAVYRAEFLNVMKP